MDKIKPMKQRTDKYTCTYTVICVRCLCRLQSVKIIKAVRGAHKNHVRKIFKRLLKKTKDLNNDKKSISSGQTKSNPNSIDCKICEGIFCCYSLFFLSIVFVFIGFSVRVCVDILHMYIYCTQYIYACTHKNAKIYAVGIGINHNNQYYCAVNVSK